MSLRSAFKTSSASETQGVYMEVSNTKIRIARAGGGNVAFTTAMQKLYKEKKRAIDLDVLSNEQALKDYMEVFAEHCIIDWQTNLNDGKTDENGYGLPDNWVVGIDDGNGGVSEFSHENVMAAFMEMRDLFTECKTFAENLQWYRQALVDGTVKN